MEQPTTGAEIHWMRERIKELEQDLWVAIKNIANLEALYDRDIARFRTRIKKLDTIGAAVVDFKKCLYADTNAPEWVFAKVEDICEIIDKLDKDKTQRDVSVVADDKKALKAALIAAIGIDFLERSPSEGVDLYVKRCEDVVNKVYGEE